MINPYTTTSSSIRLVLADDHTIFRSALSNLLKQHDNLQVVAEASNGQELVDAVQEKRPDVVLTDINMPGMCGVEATGIIRNQFSNTKIIALTMHEGLETIRQMLHAGADGYLLKNSDVMEVLQAVHTVHQNGIHYCSTASAKVLQSMTLSSVATDGKKEHGPFGERDLQIIRLLCHQHCSKEIADQLNTTCRAVEGARQRIQEKIGARNMVGIVVYAIRTGIFCIE